jgi:hypothetical protein
VLLVGAGFGLPPLKAVTPNQRNREKLIARVLENRAKKVKGPQERFDKPL